MKNTYLLFISIVFFNLLPVSLKAQAPTQCTDVMLQAFYWDSYTDSKWTNLSLKADEISGSFDLVWLPASGNALGNGMGYLPVYYFDQNSKFGSKAELKTLISTLKTNGTECLADIVVNHRNGVSNWTNFPAEIYNGVTYTWGPEAICSTDEVRNEVGQATPTGAADTGDDFNGGRDIDHTNVNVRNTIKAYLQFMKNDMGYAGWRFDMTKGFSAGYIGEYCDAAGAGYSVGEYWDSSWDALNAWIKGTGNKSTTFDFSLKYALNEAFAGNDLTKLVWTYNGVNQPAGLIHHPDTKRYATTFVDNHDTGRSDNTSRFTGNVLAANAFILSSPGVPCIWLSHWNANKDKIREMIAARKAVQLHSESTVTVNQTSANIYVATVTGKLGKLIVKIGSGTYNAPAGFTLATSGTYYAIWTDIAVTNAPTLTVSPVGGTYIGGTSVTLSTGSTANIYYTIDGSTPSVGSTKYTLPISIATNNTVLKAIAIDSNGKSSFIATHSYYTQAAEGITLRFKAPVSWTTVAVYIWENNSTTLAGNWPGTILTKDAGGFYSYTLTNQTANTVGIVFNNNNLSQQTKDLSASASTCWEYGTSTISGNNTLYDAMVTTCPGTDVDNPIEDTWNLYPNPTRDLIHFKIPVNTSNISITSALGVKLIFKTKTADETLEMDISTYPTGIYYITVYNKNGLKETKAIVKM